MLAHLSTRSHDSNPEISVYRSGGIRVPDSAGHGGPLLAGVGFPDVRTCCNASLPLGWWRLQSLELQLLFGHAILNAVPTAAAAAAAAAAATAAAYCDLYC